MTLATGNGEEIKFQSPILIIKLQYTLQHKTSRYNNMHVTIFITCYVYAVVDLKAAPKYGRSPSAPANPSPMGTPQRRAADTHQSQVSRYVYFSLHIYFSP